MNQSTLKTFAQTARRELRSQIELRLDFVLRTDSAELRQRAPQVKTLKEALAREGREALVERVAYTWFNRLAALRFMDANGYHPFGARVVTAASPQETLPEALQQARAGVLDADLRAQLDSAETFDGVLSGAIPTASREGSAYRMLLVAACHFYHRMMPFLFEKLGDATELLLPEDLLTEHSVVNPFRTDLADEDCRDVEVIGWLYQFYISEKKDAVMGRKTVVPREDIPAVTQLFTPHWIVRYLVENSLGRLWLLNRPASRLREKMAYYIEVNPATEFIKISGPEEIKLIDPAVGSGHMLTYAYDLLYTIYEEEGYDAPEIPGHILKHNLYGIDICDRAVALAAFALVMKARGSDNRFFRRVAQPNLISLQEVRFGDGELTAYFNAIGIQSYALHPQLNKLLHEFEEAKNFGSLIQPCLTEQEILGVRSQISNRQSAIDTGDLMVAAIHRNVMRVLEQAEALTQRYHLVVANPPYMTGGMNALLSEMVTTSFGDSRSDLSATFITRARRFCLPSGLCGLVTMHSWMFLPTLAGFRKALLSSCRIYNLAHHGIGAFPTLNSKVVQTVAFTFGVSPPAQNDVPVCFRLLDYDPVVKERQLRARERCFSNVKQSDFSKIEGWPLAYWLSEAIIASFQQSPISSRYTLKEGLGTRNDPHFLRCFWEVDVKRTRSEKNRKAKWIRTDKAGAARKWYGNHYFVMNWENDGFEIKNYRNPDGSLKSRPQNTQFFFRQAVTWGKVGTIAKTFRLRDSDLAFNDAAPSAFGENLLYLLALLNSKVFEALLDVQGDTMNVTLGVVGILPFIEIERENQRIVERSEACTMLARADWDNFETSWDFRDHPLLRLGTKGTTLESSWLSWKAQTTAAIGRMQEMETVNNRLFIAAYGLDGELQPEVREDQITLAHADARKDVAAFLSYAVGCMMGRYSLDQPGLILANAGSTVADYHARISAPTFAPDADGILPVLDGEWFADDVVSRLGDFLRTTFGKDAFTENVAFIETSLGKELRRYFAKEFYKEHLKTYKKRPIYWMVGSPEGSFQALIYLHRYTRDTVNTLLTEYVREFLHKLEAREQELTAVTLNESSRPDEKTKAVRELGKIGSMLKEIRAWERDVVLPLAQQRIELDLDDGVKMNYLKFPGLLVPIPGLEKKEEE